MRSFSLSITDTCCFSGSSILSLREERFSHSLSHSLDTYLGTPATHQASLKVLVLARWAKLTETRPWRWQTPLSSLFRSSPARPFVIWHGGRGGRPLLHRLTIKWSRGQRWSEASPRSCFQPFPFLRSWCPFLRAHLAPSHPFLLVTHRFYLVHSLGFSFSPSSSCKLHSWSSVHLLSGVSQ